MSLLKQQDFLAKLYTDERLRRDFTFDPPKIGAENALTENEIREISAIFHDEINYFAASLWRKRLHEAGKLLPLTKTILSEDFDESFRRFAQNHRQNKSVRRHLDDAIGFCLFLQNCESVAAIGRDAARYENASLKFHVVGAKFVFCRLQYDFAEYGRENAALNPPNKKPRFVFWLKFGKTVKHFVVPTRF